MEFPDWSYEHGSVICLGMFISQPARISCEHTLQLTKSLLYPPVPLPGALSRSHFIFSSLRTARNFGVCCSFRCLIGVDTRQHELGGKTRRYNEGVASEENGISPVLFKKEVVILSSVLCQAFVASPGKSVD